MHQIFDQPLWADTSQSFGIVEITRKRFNAHMAELDAIIAEEEHRAKAMKLKDKGLKRNAAFVTLSEELPRLIGPTTLGPILTFKMSACTAASSCT